MARSQLSELFYREIQERLHDDNPDLVIIYNLQYPGDLPRMGRPTQEIPMFDERGILNLEWYESFMAQALHQHVTVPGGTAVSLVRYYLERGLNLTQIRVVFHRESWDSKQRVIRHLTGRSRMFIVGHCEGGDVIEGNTGDFLPATELAHLLVTAAPHLREAEIPLVIQLWSCYSARNYAPRLLYILNSQGIFPIITAHQDGALSLRQYPNKQDRMSIIQQEVEGQGLTVFYVRLIR